jgi:hypothetical protein
MDFADALHLALAGQARGLVTLDKGIQAHADRLGLRHPVVLVPNQPEPEVRPVVVRRRHLCSTHRELRASHHDVPHADKRADQSRWPDRQMHVIAGDGAGR